MRNKEEEKAYFRAKLRPIVAEINNRLQTEENRREMQYAKQKREGNIK